MDIGALLKNLVSDLVDSTNNAFNGDEWFYRLHPAVFAQWSTQLRSAPIEVVEAFLQQKVPIELVGPWWRRFGFSANNVEDILLLLDRDATLKTLLTYAVEGALWRVAKSYMVSYSPDDHIPIEAETTQEMKQSRHCAKHLWRRLWSEPTTAIKAPSLFVFVSHHPTTIAALWAEEPDEAYLAQLGAASFIEKRQRICFFKMLLETFPQDNKVIEWLFSEGASCEEAWRSIWYNAENHGHIKESLELPHDLILTN